MVEIETAEGHKIRRVRGKGDNYYELNGEQYKAFAKSVPDDIVRILNMNELNFARQMDGPFGFSMSGTEFAQYLNKLVDLDIIGKSLSNVNSMVRSAQTEQTQCEQRIAALEESVEKLQWVEQAEADVAELERMEAKVRRLRKRVADAEQALERHENAKQNMERLSFVPSALADYAQVEEWAQAVSKLANSAEMLDSCHKSYERAAARVQDTKWVTHAEKAILELAERQGEVREKERKYQSILNALEKYKKTLEDVDRTGSNLEQYMVYFSNNKPEICPTCGQVWR